MRAAELAELLRFRRPRLRRADRVLDRCVTVADLHRAALRYWPRGVRGYVDGGADGEVSLARNRAAFTEYELVPTVLRDVSAVDTSTTLLGRTSPVPFALGPTGYTRMMHPDGELAVAGAARTAGVPYTVSTMSTVSLEDVAAVGGDLWFQLYIWRDRDLMRRLIARAVDAGYRCLMVTVDTAVSGLRVRDHHNGFTLPPRLSMSTVAEMVLHPAWWAGLLTGPAITFANVARSAGAAGETVMAFAARQFDPSVTWDDVAEVRSLWPGPLVLKGAFSPEDVQRATQHGIDAVVLSNHGGRQLDRAWTPLRALPEIRRAIGADFPLLVDSGIRRGADIAIALALGASACLIGRPYLYGLGAAGEPGCAAAITMLGSELTRSMQLLGMTSIDELRQRGTACLRRYGPPGQPAPFGRGADAGTVISGP